MSPHGGMPRWLELAHPALVHFPIAFAFLELALLALWAARRDPAFDRFARISFRMGYAFMLLALLSGFVSAGGWGHVGGRTGPHFKAALAVWGFYSVRGLYSRTGKNGVGIRLAGALAGNLLVGWAGYLGGKLVYS